MDISTKYRTLETEIMDDFDLEGEELQDALDKIASINKLLGGNALTLDGVKQLLEHADKSKIITIADIGCGNGDMLRVLSEYGNKNGYSLRLIGIDANKFTVKYAEKLSQQFEDIEYYCLNVFSEEFKNLKYDIYLCTLTLHHFTDEQILKIMKVFYNNATIGVVINDLHRSKAAYRLFGLICRVFRLNRMSREDGLVSILKGFTKDELKAYSRQLNFKESMIRWKWAFRYQWIIRKI